MLLVCLPLWMQAQVESVYLPKDSTLRSIELKLDRFKAMHNSGVFTFLLGSGAVLLNEYAGKGDDGITALGASLAAIGTGMIFYAPNELDGRSIYFFKRRNPY